MNKNVKIITADVVAVVAILRTGELGVLCATAVLLIGIFMWILKGL